jgi:MFS transporter, PPP family, 3-phenylpropionic acid transporter
VRIIPAPATFRLTTPFRKIAAINFLRYAALGLSAPFFAVYLTRQGYSATQIGTLVSIGSILALTLDPILNHLATTMGGHRRLWSGLIISGSLASLAFAVLTRPWQLGGAFLLNMATLRGSNGLLNQLSIKRFDQLKVSLFSRSRMWGAVGWSVSTIASSLVLRFGSYPHLFAIAAITGIAALFFVSELPRTTFDKNDPAESHESQPRRIGFYILAAAHFFFFLGMGTSNSFIWVFFEQDLNVPDFQIGLMAALLAILELPAMLLLDGWVARLGARNVYLMGLVGMGVVWLGYSVMDSVIWLIPIAVLRGVAFSMTVVGIALMVARTSHPVNVATNQAIIEGTMPGLAFLLTGPIAGWLFDNLGSEWMWRYGAVMSLVGALILFINFRRLDVEVTPTHESKQGMVLDPQ